MAALFFLAACAEPTAAEPIATPGRGSSGTDAVPSAPVNVHLRREEPAQPATRGTVILVPLRSFPEDLLAQVEQTLERELLVQVRRHAPAPLPKSAYYQPRRRYRAEQLLDHLLTFVQDEPESTRVLGLTEVDISTTKGDILDWGIFGLAYSPGRSAVVSSHRLKRRTKNRERVRFRVANTALHEIGHSFGLPHCTEPRCPMQDAEGGIENTDGSQGHLGPACQRVLDHAAPVP